MLLARLYCRPILGKGGLGCLAFKIQTPKPLVERLGPRSLAGVAMGVSPETVKWHLKNVDGKLGVFGRDDAVARARDVGLVGLS